MQNPPETPVICIAMANERSDQGFLRGLSIEMKSIMNSLRPAIRAGKVEVAIIPAATAREIADTFQDVWYRNRVKIFHYAGHADEDELWLEDDSGGNQRFSSLGLARFLGNQRGLELVFLNGCATQNHADLLTGAGIPTAMVTAAKINDEQATTFASRFYKGLAGGAHVKAAFIEAEAYVLGNTQDVQEDIDRGLFWKKEKENETIQFPWRMFSKETSAGGIPTYWKLFGEPIDDGEMLTEAEAIAKSFIGLTFSNFKIVKLLGDGSNGMVFKAVHETFHEEVAIKVTHRIISGFNDVKRILSTGNRGLRFLKHPNLAGVFDFGTLGRDHMYFIMELVKGERMDKMNLDVTGMDIRDIDQLIGYAIQICEGIQAAHDHTYTNNDGSMQEGVIHGNLRQKKVLFTPGGIPKIIDFLFTDLSQAEGVELLVPDDGKEEKVPQPLENYLPPEVVSKKAAVSKLTDVYSLGAMFFEILAGIPISEAGEVSIDAFLELFQRKNPLIPPKLAEVIYWAVHPEPFSRSQRVEEIIVGLKECLSASPEEVNAAEIVQAEEQEDLQAIIDSLLFRVVSGYRIQDFLGEGLQGLVFKGVHEETGAETAIKITHRIKEGFETADRILQRNYRLIKALDHPNVAKVIDMGYIGNEEYIYVVMELVKGMRLDKMKLDLTRMDRGDIHDVLELALEICEGVHAAHTMEFVDDDGEIVYGVMHGNLKTRKIIVGEEDSPKIIDFMFAEVLDSEEVVIATPKDIRSKNEDRPEDYLPPEVVWQGHKVNKRKDVYSLGAILYELFSGRPLGVYHPRTEYMLRKILRQRNPRVPRQLSKALFKAIHPEPYLRYNTVWEFMKDLLKNMPLPKRLLYSLRNR